VFICGNLWRKFLNRTVLGQVDLMLPPWPPSGFPLRENDAVARSSKYTKHHPPSVAHAASHENQNRHRTRPVHDASRMHPTALRLQRPARGRFSRSIALINKRNKSPQSAAELWLALKSYRPQKSMRGKHHFRHTVNRENSH